MTENKLDQEYYENSNSLIQQAVQPPIPAPFFAIPCVLHLALNDLCQIIYNAIGLALPRVIEDCMFFISGQPFLTFLPRLLGDVVDENKQRENHQTA
jgi:hypothetical protein